jgi:methionyl-tRNA formyltransferase
MATKKIVLLAGKGFSTTVLYNMLDTLHGVDVVIIEKPVGKKKFIKNRIKKLGFTRVFGQILFQLIVVPLLNAISKRRTEKIQQQYQLNSNPIPVSKIKNVDSVNSEETRKLLEQLNPALVIVNGTRIISTKTLSAVPAKFINMHAGITPKYRGVHGAYWALVKGDKNNCGVTVHLVDQGIDTGAIVYQENIEISKEDNFITYPVLQLAQGLPLLAKAIKDIEEDNLQLIQGTRESHLWYHPTIWQYIYYRLARKVK